MKTTFNFLGTPVVKDGFLINGKTEDGFLIDGTTPNDAVKIFLYLKDTYFCPSWKYGITLPYFIPNMKKGDS